MTEYPSYKWKNILTKHAYCNMKLEVNEINFSELKNPLV